jgi:hypothetical protein
MSVVADKYRGSKEYLLVYRELITAAHYRGLVSYKAIAKILGIEPTGHHMAREVGLVLGEVSEDEHKRSRPLLSALAVGVIGKPGDGFFQLARQLGKQVGETTEAQSRFWQEEKAAAYEEWSSG